MGDDTLARAVVGTRSPEAEESLRCEACGLLLLPMLKVAGNDDKEETRSNMSTMEARDHGVMGDDGDLHESVVKSLNEQAKKQPAKQPILKPRLRPGVVHAKAVRKVVRQEMIACIPGFNRARARAVVEAFPNSTFTEIMSASPSELSSVLAAAEKTLVKDSELRSGLVKALRRVLQ